jgi:hypothetical protein
MVQKQRLLKEFVAVIVETDYIFRVKRKGGSVLPPLK